jgi:argininosuccinate synthase
MTVKKIVVAFSGGLDTTFCAAWLREMGDAEIVTVTVDTGGFDAEELAEIPRASKRAGAHHHVTVDGKDEVFDRIISRIIQGNVLRGGVYPLCVSAERMIQAELLVREAKRLGAVHGVGRGVHLGDTILGIKGRIAFEAPAAAILIPAHRELEKLVLTRWQQFWKDQVSGFLGTVIHEALAHDPVFDDIGAMISSSQKTVCGNVRVGLCQGRVRVDGVQSRNSLVDQAAAVYGETQSLWSGDDAAGFTRIYGIQSALAHRVKALRGSSGGEAV